MALPRKAALCALQTKTQEMPLPRPNGSLKMDVHTLPPLLDSAGLFASSLEKLLFPVGSRPLVSNQ